MSFEEDFIAHYGKPGMKWGQRKAAVKTFSKTRSGKTTAAALLGGPLAGIAINQMNKSKKPMSRKGQTITATLLGGPLAGIAVNQLNK